MRKKYIKLMVVGAFIVASMAGCGSNGKEIYESSSGIVSEEDNKGEYGTEQDTEQSEIGDIGDHSEVQESQTDTATELPEDNKNSQSQTTEEDANIEAELAAYREKREQGTSTQGNYTMIELPNEENYKYGVGDSDSYVSRFDSKELNEAFKAADTYIRETLHLESETWACADPRMTSIYEDEDKGVAEGYDAENIFLCEYCDNGKWQYLILVREGKGSDWKVLYNGNSYKTN